MKLAFVTCVELGFRCIEEIYNIGEKIEAAITLKDNIAKNKSGRVYLDSFCKKNKIELLKIDSINELTCEKFLKEKKFDWIFIIGWSQIASKNILEIPNYGIIGAHPTLLPQGRGRASIPWAILKGLEKTGVSFFKINQGVDTGDIIHQEEIIISENDDATILYEKVKVAHFQGISKIIPKLENFDLKLIKQDDSKSSYWPGRKPEDGEINMNGSVLDAHRLIRATTNPYPGAFFYKGEKKIIVWKAKILKKNILTKNTLSFHDGFLLLEKTTTELI